MPSRGCGRIHDDAVQLVDAAVVQRCVDLVVLHPRLGLQEAVRPADRQPVGRQREVVRDDDLDAVGIDRHRRRAFDGVGDALEADPAAGVAAHRPAVQAEVDDLLHRRRIQHRHHRRGELVIGLVRQRGRLGRVVVAGQHQHAAVFRRAREVRVLEHVAAAVDTGTLAVPHREDAIDLRVRVQVDLLRAPDGRRGEVLVQPRLELDVGAIEELLRLPQRLVEAAQRRAAVPGHEARGVQAGQPVALALQDQQADQRLDAGDENASRFELVLVVERNVRERETNCRGGHRESSKNRVPDRAAPGRASQNGLAIVSPTRNVARILRFFPQLRPAARRCNRTSARSGNRALR